MFSLILQIQAFLEKLKKRKALWFTTITTLALLGVVGTMSYLNTMTQRATKNLYETTNASYFKDLDVKIGDSLANLEIVGSLLLANPDFIAAVNVQDNAAALTEKLNTLGANLKEIVKNGIEVELYNQNFIKVASSSSSVTLTQEVEESDALRRTWNDKKAYKLIEYEDGKVYLKALFPTEKGVLEVKRSVDFLFDIYDGNGKIFNVLLDRDFLDMKRLQAYKFQRIGKDEVSVQAKVDTVFLQKINDVDFDKVIESKYIIQDGYFVLAKPLLNLDGKKVGVLVLGENLEKEASLPRMVKKISTGLTTAAIGLVVALLVLMI